MRRTHRELVIDLGIVLLAVSLSFGAIHLWANGVEIYPQLSQGAGPMGLINSVQPWKLNARLEAYPVALLPCLLLWWRRRWPVAVAVPTLLLATITPSVVPAIVALVTVASRCSARTVVWLAVLALIPLPLFLLRDPSLGNPGLTSALIGVPLLAAAVGWGLFARSLSDRTDRAEAEAVLRAGRAQQQAREDVAREMHDVLAHRLSLLSVHAGALEFNPGAPREEIGRAAGVIRDSAHQALEELQGVLRVLRDPAGDGSTEPPQPTLADVGALVAEAQHAGMSVALDQRIAGPAAGQGGIAGRTAYRIVQEGLTNARKHAHLAPVRITLHGGPREGLSLELRNSIPRGAPHSGIPGTGQGLIGLAERAALAGGTVSYGRSADDFRLHAWLPWPA
ncbi:sensor histidine kinase [Streptacidiphilus sp. PAMC 29251]